MKLFILGWSWFSKFEIRFCCSFFQNFQKWRDWERKFETQDYLSFFIGFNNFKNGFVSVCKSMKVNKVQTCPCLIIMLHFFQTVELKSNHDCVVFCRFTLCLPAVFVAHCCNNNDLWRIWAMDFTSDLLLHRGTQLQGFWPQAP